MRISQLKRTYVQDNSFIISMLKRKSKDTLSKDDKQDLVAFGYSGIGVYKVDERK